MHGLWVGLALGGAHAERHRHAVSDADEQSGGDAERHAHPGPHPHRDAHADDDPLSDALADTKRRCHAVWDAVALSQHRGDALPDAEHDSVPDHDGDAFAGIHAQSDVKHDANAQPDRDAIRLGFAGRLADVLVDGLAVAVADGVADDVLRAHLDA